jgi:hypothetical protein
MGNSWHSQIAEGFARHCSGDVVEAHGTMPQSSVSGPLLA